MSNRDSLGFGDLLPQDVVDIFAQEKHSRRGQKKRSRSLGRALGWLKGKKRKDLGGKGQSPGLGPALDLALDGHPAGHQGGHKGGQRSGRQNYPQAIPKLDDDDKTPAPPLFQENVFIEASRPKYLENLHSEAQEGLKMMQQEETNNGVEYRDNESTISTVTVQTDGEGGGFVTDSTIGDTTSVVSVQSSVSTRSSRSGLTRQGSTFRPLNSGKKSEKAKIRRRHRKTVAGIPQHVQMELGLDRGGWKATKTLDEEQLYNGETDDSLTNDGSQQAPQKGASARLHDTNAIQPLNKDQLEQLSDTYAGHRDDMALLHCLVPDLSGEQRPRSLAVPWMTTANSLQQEPPSPVMSMSPQAAYMSKIIPNAVLPPSIDVVEISRGRSRNSVRTVSKTSLLLSSPAPSRASSRASSSRTTSSRASTITSASRYKPPNLSDSSCWSNSESSETLVSESSTISSSSTPKQKRPQDRDGPTKEDKNTVQSSIGKKTKSTSNGKVIITEDLVKKEGSFVRSLSVMKPKRAPPPPNRSYSLHGKMKRRSRDLAEVTVISGEASGEENGKNKSGSSPMPSVIIESPGYSADTSSLEDSTGSVSFSPLRSQLQALNAKEAAKVVETVSKDASEEKQKLLRDNKLNKTVSPSSGYSSQDGTSTQLPKQPYSSSPRHKRGILAKLQRFFPGSTAATTPPPLTNPEALENIKSTEDLKPDTSVDTASVSPSVRTLIDLFNIPPPPKVHAPPPPPPEVWAHSKRSIELLLGPPVPDNTHAIIKKNPKDRRQQRKSPSTFTDGSVQSLVTERKHKNPTVTVESVNGSLHVLEPKKVKESGILNVEIHKEKNDRLAEQNVDLKGNRIVTEKDEKVRVSDILNGMLAKAVERREERLTPLREEEAKKTLTHTTDNMDTLTAISLQRILPSPSPPVHNPPKPPTKQTTEFTSVPSAQVVSPELSWPPPPPPTGMSAPDEMDFPLPPPPVFSEEELVLPVQVPPETTISSGDSLCTTTSVVSVVKTQCVRVTTEAEPQKPSTSQGNVHKPLYIPPPPSYTAPPPPTKAVSPLTVIKVSPLQPEEVSPPPPPKEVSLPPPKEHPPPLPKEVPPSPPKEVSPPPPKEPSPPPKEVFPPPPEEVPPPPCEEISPPLPKEVSPLPSEDVSLRPPKEFSLPPPKEVSPPPKQVSPVKPKESAPPLIQAPLPSVKDVSSTLVTVVSPSPVKEVSPLPPQEVTTLSTEEVSPPSSQENAHQSPEEATTVIKLTPPQSIPPPPPLMSQPQSSETDLPLENVPAESETSPVSSNSILTPPQSIPPPPPIQLLHQPQVSSPNTDGLVTQEAHHSPPPEVSIHSALENSLPTEKARDPLPSPPVNISLPPPLPVQGLASIKLQPSPASTENQPPELTSAPVVQEEPTPIVTPSLLQMVKLRSVSSSPELPEAQEHPETEVTMGTQQPSNQIPTSSLSGEAPQKPIRKSLIMTSATSTSPPAIITSQPSLPTPQSIVVPPASSSTVLSPTKKSPSVMTASPSMNLQEAIRLRTAARSLGPTASRLSLHSPTSPTDLHKSPTNTASFIFSKSNKKVVIETKPAPETNTTIHRNLEVFSGTKGLIEGESVKKEVKVPPPVAKKPKTKGKEIETSEGTEQTAGQEALQESVMDAAEKSNGTAGTVEGGGTPST
uniref:proteoglycan 4-like isoform X2 n=1 Tax=Scatophagus argus TaxID=75038 RepID=UPI001ED7D44C|nr:proteoglycan 4-like isoform X2 [Scatophagus argus]